MNLGQKIASTTAGEKSCLSHTGQRLASSLERLGVEALFIELGSPWENGYIESFNGKLRDELLNREIFTTLTEAKIRLSSCGGSTIRYVLIARWGTGRRPLRLKYR